MSTGSSSGGKTKQAPYDPYQQAPLPTDNQGYEADPRETGPMPEGSLGNPFAGMSMSAPSMPSLPDMGGVGDWAARNVPSMAASAIGGPIAGMVVGTGVGTYMDMNATNKADDIYRNAGLPTADRSFGAMLGNNIPGLGWFIDNPVTAAQAQANVNTMNIQEQSPAYDSPFEYVSENDGGWNVNDIAWNDPPSGGDYYSDSTSVTPEGGWEFRKGGYIPNRGGKALAKVPVTAHEGEFIIRPEAVKKYGPRLFQYLNRGLLG